MIFGIRGPALEAARPLPLLYSSASDFQFRYAPVTVILGYKNQRDAWWQNKKAPGAWCTGGFK